MQTQQPKFKFRLWSLSDAEHLTMPQFFAAAGRSNSAKRLRTGYLATPKTPTDRRPKRTR